MDFGISVFHSSLQFSVGQAALLGSSSLSGDSGTKDAPIFQYI